MIREDLAFCDEVIVQAHESILWLKNLNESLEHGFSTCGPQPDINEIE